MPDITDKDVELLAWMYQQTQGMYDELLRLKADVLDTDRNEKIDNLKIEFERQRRQFIDMADCIELWGLDEVTPKEK